MTPSYLPRLQKFLTGLLTVTTLFFCPKDALAATVTVNTLSGSSSPVDGSLDGVDGLPDSWFGTSYNGYVGELGIVFDSAISSQISGTPTGMFQPDAGDTYAGRVGSYTYCVDSDTTLLTSSSSSQTYNLDAVSVSEANDRYIAAGVSNYIPDSILRAAYLIDTYAATSHAGGDIDTAALQEAVWEVLYDTNPNLTEGQGNYFVRSTVNGTAASVATLGNTMLSDAATNNWGGAGYDPTNVVIWMDPSNPLLNQSLISLFPPELRNAIPEPGTVALALAGLATLAVVRRKKSQG